MQQQSAKEVYHVKKQPSVAQMLLHGHKQNIRGLCVRRASLLPSANARPLHGCDGCVSPDRRGSVVIMMPSYNTTLFMRRNHKPQ